MSPERFDHLVSLLRPKISKKHCVREPISPEERLAVTLRFLATGDSQHSLGFLFKMGRSTINGIINEVCYELWNVLSEYVKPPTMTAVWSEISDDFNEPWNLPNCWSS